MGTEEVTTSDMVSFVSGQILSGPEDSIYDDIFDWIANAIGSITGAVAGWINSAVSTIKSWVTSVVNSAWSGVSGIFSGLMVLVKQIWGWAYNINQVIWDLPQRIYSTLSYLISSRIEWVRNWVSSGVSQVMSWVSSQVSQVWEWITTTATNLGSQIWGWLQETGAGIGATFASWGEAIKVWWHYYWLDLTAGYQRLGGEMGAGFQWVGEKVEEFPDLLDEHIKQPIMAWWDDFMDKLPAMFENIWLTVWGWLKTAWDNIVHFFSHTLVNGIMSALGWLTDLVRPMIETVLENIMGLLKNIAPISPEGGAGAVSGLANIGLVMGGGLAAMTVAGHLIHPIKTLGLGQVSAMIYDMSNYKLILGAFMGAVATTAIRTPITYYLNSMMRPWLLSPRDFMQLMSRQAFRDPESLQNPELVESVRSITGGNGLAFENRMIGYQGYPAAYYGFFKELANTPLRYFPLAGIARTGFFERTWFTEALHRSGYSKTAIDALMVMYEKMVDEAVQGTMSGAAVKRFKEGLTTEEQFKGELLLLGYSDQQFPKYLAAAKMDYAYDYTMDLVSAYRDAIRKGNLSFDGYRGALLALGIVPERVEAYVLKERARLKPTEALIPIGPPTPTYETDAGKVKVDTTRRERRKLLITRDQEIAAFVQLGMEPGYATAVADNDDVRLAEKGGEE